ncbi:MAG: hypothetical protein RSC76_07285, partial [Oscillospiraceae bacterium]
MFKKKTFTPKAEIEKRGYDSSLISKIQPQGNLKLNDERYICTGDGYVSCIQIYEYPGQVYDFWLSDLLNIEGVYSIFDVATEESDAAQDSIITSLNELDVRYSRAQEEGTRIETEQKHILLKDMLTTIKTQGEVIKLIQCRLYISGRTKQKVDEKIAEVIKHLESLEYRCAIFLNETEYQYKALFSPY